ncbi:S-layer family protein [Nostoc sp. TCL26-01]|uniref:beta strand repeat-containing protein n=1 Tax=Nostoc sp. TCL26-01 TaxID=2576904 RepID=UPI0015BC630E|nr:M10 family metallopeptidase C-terminal domain-containing protein [Nostoc sp. TCL26-01]QLE57378.1 sodium:calcium exchanger [Nostoc sp. TCL26-01]
MAIQGTNNDDNNLIGTAGNDIIQGLGGDDTLSGLGGDDQLSGGTGSDSLSGGAGKDQFVLEYFNGSGATRDEDLVVDFQKGQDQIDVRTIGISDFNTILILANDDPEANALITTRYNVFDDTYYYRLKIDGISKSQLLASDFNFSTALVNDNITGTNNDDDLFGGLGNDTLQGNGGDDRLFGEQGDDKLSGGSGSDTLYGGAGKDQFVLEYFNGSGATRDEDLVVDFQKGQDQIDVRTIGISDFNTILILANDDPEANALITTRYNVFDDTYYYRLKIDGISKSQLLASDFNFSTALVNDNITGTNNDDDLFGGLGNDTLQGNGGDDRLFGEQGDDKLSGGSGSDTLYGGAGKDQFVLEYFNGSGATRDEDLVVDFQKGQDQIDVRTIGISDFNTILILTSDNPDGNALITTRYNVFDDTYYYRLKIDGISKSQLLVSDFNLKTAVVDDIITGTNNDDDLFGGLGNDTLQGNGGDDRLFGEQGDDKLSGGSGSDTLYGGAGKDQFVLEYFNGSGATRDEDLVVDFQKGQDQIDVRTIGISDFNTILILTSDNPDGNALITTRYNVFDDTYYYRLKIDGISKSQLLVSDFNLKTAVVDDIITGTNNDDDLFGGLGNDTLQGNGGDDRLFGEQGDDKLSGGSGSDTLYGGAGKDQFVLEYFNGSGATRDEDLVVDFQKGQDQIDVRTIGISDFNTILILTSDNPDGNALITTRYNVFDDTYYYRLKIDGISKSQLLVSDFNLKTAVVDDIITGTNNDDDLFGGLGNDTLQGNGGDDRLFGEQGDDKLSGGSGSDTLYGGAGNDIAVYLGTRSQYQVTSSAGVFTVTDTVANRDGVDTLREIEQIRFSDQTITIGSVLSSITLAVSPASVTEDGTTNLTYTFTRTGSTTNALTINFGVAGTATLNTDYTQTGAASFTATTGTITFAAGASTAILTVNPTADTFVENNETVALTLASGTGYTVGTTTAVTGTITNDDFPSITLAVSPASVTEDGTTNLIYTFTRTGSTTNALTINFGVAGTATLNTDYTQTGAASFTATTGTITFAAGASTAILTVNPTADTTVESNETVALTLASGTGYTIGTATAVTGTITNDDPSGITINLSPGQTIVEGLTSPQNAAYTVTLSQASSQVITVQYGTAGVTAIAGSDYTGTTGTLTFNPGETSKVINIPILNDSVNEADETFTFRLTSPTNATLGTSNTVTTTITDTLSAAVTTTLPTNVENLTLTGTAAINGTGNAGNNILKGNSANNTLSGSTGNDTYAFVANTALGTDTISETATGGIDTIDFTGSTVAVKVNLGVTTSQTVNSNLKLILSANNVIENATGGTGNDRLTGNSLNNILSGGSGNDQIQGLAGDDTLFGGAGDDILTGGAGRDKYLFQGGGVSTLGVDYISTFEVGQDQFVLSKASFTAVINGVGQALSDFAVVSDDEFVNASNARIVFSQGSGSLFYNQDGNVLGTGTVFEFARLGNPDITLSGSDFSLIA